MRATVKWVEIERVEGLAAVVRTDKSGIVVVVEAGVGVQIVTVLGVSTVLIMIVLG